MHHPVPRAVVIGVLGPLGLLLCGVACSSSTDEAGGPVRVVKSDVYLLASGEEIRRDSAEEAARVEAHVVGADGAEEVFVGARADDGTAWVIEGVPDGPYTLVVETQADGDTPGVVSRELQTARTVDHGAHFMGRPDVALARQDTPVTFVVDPLELPWQEAGEDTNAQDTIDLHSHDADLWGFVHPEGEDFGALNGATALEFTTDWADVTFDRSGTGAPLLEAGDVLVLSHSVDHPPEPDADPDDPWANRLYSAMMEAGTAPPVTMKDGEPVEIAAAFEELPLDTFSLDFRLSDFATELLDRGLRPAVIEASVDGGQEPGEEVTTRSFIPPFFSVSVFGARAQVDDTCYPGIEGCDESCGGICNASSDTTATPPDGTLSILFGNPYARGVSVLSCSVLAGTTLIDPSSKGIITLRSLLLRVIPLAEADGAPIAPALGLPRDVEVGGERADASRIHEGVGSGPVVRWAAPALGTAERYRVRVVRWSDEATPYLRASRSVIATWTTTATEVTLPEGTLEAGRLYSATVIAEADGAAAEAPFKPRGHASSYAEVTTGLFTP